MWSFICRAKSSGTELVKELRAAGYKTIVAGMQNHQVCQCYFGRLLCEYGCLKEIHNKDNEIFDDSIGLSAWQMDVQLPGWKYLVIKNSRTFSIKAFMPSRWSSWAKQSENKSFSIEDGFDVTFIAAVNGCLYRARLFASEDFSASTKAQSNSESAETTWLTKPIVAASSATIISPV